MTEPTVLGRASGEEAQNLAKHLQALALCFNNGHLGASRPTIDVKCGKCGVTWKLSDPLGIDAKFYQFWSGRGGN